ncbi:hypothetical protein FHY55_17905 [Oceanicola sp. D3]|uniref:hypothetical protein n=1 Tax=Oceanicola sp. D3 TaxID=2587163 RepID=UPI0011243D73|nr:hypothetical protein [Oceanicola sp. D3]QDC10992.1 hypothetical protein FHY55_17905 [Oceanicola sp. D3]
MQTIFKSAAGGARFPVLVVLTLTAAAILAVPVLDAKAVSLARGTIMDVIDQDSMAFVKGFLPE